MRTFRHSHALILLLLILLTSCGGTPASSTAPTAAATTAAAEATDATAPTAEVAPTSEATSDETVTLLWGFWGSPEERASHERVAAEFEKTHPEIKITIWNQPWSDYFTKLNTLWAAGDPSQIPDVLFLWPTPSYAANGVLEDLTPYIERDGYNLDDYWPALLESAKYDGKVYGFPRDIDTSVLYYNKQIFDEAGVAYPTDDWTWDDLRAAAEKLTVIESSGRVTRYGLAVEAGKWPKFVLQNGGSIVDDPRNPSKCTLSEPAATEAIEFLAGLFNDNLAIRDASLSQAGGDAAVFQSGQAATIIQNSSRVAIFNSAGLSYDVAAAPFPKNGQRANAAGGAAWVISAQSAHKDAAWTFLSWLQSAEGGETLYTKAGDIFPALQSVARSDAFLKSDQPPANREAFLIEGENAKIGGFGYFPEWSELSGSIIGPGLEPVWAGTAKPADALPQICQQVDAFLKEKGYPKP